MCRQKTTRALRAACGVLIAAGFAAAAAAQDSGLPQAPEVRLLAAGQSPSLAAGGPAPAQNQPAQAAAGQSSSAQPAAGPALTVEQAEQIAIQHNPNISVARLLALAQAQVTREVRSVELPMA
ncbi:MAG: hypothetical protein WBX18_07985, partial [Terracidiphilus sp.]